MILYLDFDGVLHDSGVFVETNNGKQFPVLRGPGELFQWAHFLSDALIPYPDVNIVLSTKWVWWFGLPFCRAALPASLAARVIGATWEGTENMPEGWIHLPRCEQVNFHAKRHGVTDWFGIDDDMQGMTKVDRERFVLTKPWLGLSDPVTMTRIESRLAGTVLCE